MGFFSKIRRRIKKIIPKEIRPFVPYIAAGMIGPAGIGGLGQTASRFMTAAAARAASDDEANLKDIARAGGLAALPSALSNYGEGAGIGAKYAKTAGDYIAKQGALKTLGAQGAIDMGIKAAELNEEALERYNRELAEQGIADKAGRRAAIRAIYEGTGTWDMDEVDSMLDTYGYRTGGRVGYADGDMVLTERSVVTPEQRNQIKRSQEADRAYNIIFERFMERFPGLATGEETMEEMIAMLQAEDVMDTPGLGILGTASAMDMITPESASDSARRIMMGDTQYGEVPEMMNGGRIGYKKGSKVGGFSEDDYEMFLEGIESAGEGLEDLEEANEIKPLPIRELRLARGGITDIEVEEGYDDGYGPDVPGMFEEIQTTTEEDTSDMMASNPEVMDSLNELSLMLFRRPLSDLTDDEYEELKDFAGQTSLKPGLIDEYRNYKYQAEEQGQTPMSPRDYFRMEFGAARLGVKKGGKVIKIMPEGVLYKGKAKDYPGIKQLIKDMKKKGTRPKKADGGLMNLGAKERADDVPARLSKNEFVMTADAVRGAGGGSVQKGADLMYDQMKRLEGQA